MFSLRPVLARARARLPLPSRRSEPAAVAWQPGGPVDFPPAIALPDEYDRVQGFAPNTGAAFEFGAARGGPAEEGPTLGRNLGRCLIADGTLYAPGGYTVFKGGMARPVIRGTPERIGAALLCNSSLAELYFGHWLLDVPALGLLAAERGLAPVAVWTGAPSGHRADYAARVGIAPRELKLAIVDELWTVDDRARNAGRAGRLREVRRRVRGPGAGPPRRVVLDRGLSGVRRNLVNAAELWAVLRDEHGFEVVDPMALSVAELVAVLRDAEIVASVEGSALCHAVLAAPEGATIFAIMPPARFNMPIKLYTDMIGLRFAFTVAEGSNADFSLPPDRLRRAMALVEGARG